VVVTDNEETVHVVSCDVQGDAAVPPTEGNIASEPEIKVLDAKPTPSSQSSGSHGSAKARSPILLYRWCFKVLPKGMVILLGFKRCVHNIRFCICCLIVKWIATYLIWNIG
jgi:hypothetical protein